MGLMISLDFRSFIQLSFDLVDVFMGPPAGLRELVIYEVLASQLKRSVDRDPVARGDYYWTTPFLDLRR